MSPQWTRSWARLGVVVLVALCLWGCGLARSSGAVLHANLGAGEPHASPGIRALSGFSERGGSVSTFGMRVPERGVEQEARARRAEVARAMAHVKAIIHGVHRVGTRVELTYWTESGALTLVGFHMKAGGSEHAGPVVDRQKLGRELELALGGYGASYNGLRRVVLHREPARWTLAYSALAAEARPPEARQLAVDLPKVAESNYRAAHALSERLLSALRVPEGGEARQELEVHLLDGRVVGWDQRLYEVVRGSGALRTVGPELVEQLSGLLLGFEEGLGPRTVRLHVRAEQRRGQPRAGGWVDEGRIQQPPGPPEMDEDFARAYRVIHEETLRRWRAEVKEGAQWAAMTGLEELALWYVGGIVLHGAGVLLELSLPVLRAALARGSAAAAGWLRTVLLRLTPEKRRAFERLWAKVLLEGESALTVSERETLREVMRHLDRIASTPLEDAEKQAIRRASRDYYKRLYPGLAKILDDKGSLFPIHHKRPLEYAHLFPAEDIGSAENLAMVRKAVHERINAVWNRFRQSHAGATRRDVEEVTRIVDEWFEPWYHRIDDPPGLTYSLVDAEQNALKALQRLSSHLP